MKKLALIMMFSVTSVVLSAEEYTIQTISALKESSITPAFEKKFKKVPSIPIRKKEGSCNVVTVGKYPSLKAAQNDLKKAKAISKDAFVRPIARITPKVCESRSAASASKAANANVEAKSNSAEKKETKAVADAPIKKEAAVAEVHEPVKSPVVNAGAAAASSSPVVQEVKPLPCKVQPCENVTNSVYVYDRNLARKSDIHEAIEYYKRSPYHTFKPVATAQR